MKDYQRVRSFLAGNITAILDNLNTKRQDHKIDADDLFGSQLQGSDAVQWDFEVPIISKREILLAEKNSLGLYVSGNALEDYKNLQDWIQDTVRDDRIQLILINKIKKIFTKANKMMFALQVTTTSGDVEAIIFPKKAPELSPILEEKMMFWVVGKIEKKKKKKPAPEATESTEPAVNPFDVTQDTTDNPEIAEAPAVEEAPEYDEEPKLLIDWLVRFDDGIQPLISKLDIELAHNRKGSFDAIDWPTLHTAPALLDTMIGTGPKKPVSMKQTDEQPIAQLKIPARIGVDTLKKIKAHIRTSPQPGTIPVEVWIEGKDGYRRAKGAFFTTQQLIDKVDKL